MAGMKRLYLAAMALALVPFAAAVTSGLLTYHCIGR